MHFKNTLTNSLVMVLILLAPPCFANHLETMGQTYDIEEPDVIKEMEDRAATADIKKHLDPEKFTEKVKGFKPMNLVKLPKTEVARTFLVDMTYTLDMDIPDGKGGILYPKGYTFNPLDFMPVPPPTLVIINGEDQDQVAWFENSPYRFNARTKLLLAGGDFYTIGHRFNRPAYFLMEPVAKKFQLQHSPCVVRPRGNMIEVEEFTVLDKKEKG